MVMLAQAGNAIVFAARSERNGVELANLLSVFRGEGNVDRPLTAAERAEPELIFPVPSDHGPAFTLGDDANAEWLQGPAVEFLALREVIDVESDVIEDYGGTSLGAQRLGEPRAATNRDHGAALPARPLGLKLDAG